MKMTRKYEDRLHLDMPFDEALERFVGVKRSELEANVAKSKKAKPSGGKKRKPPDVIPQGENVVSLRNRRTRKRNNGR